MIVIDFDENKSYRYSYRKLTGASSVEGIINEMFKEHLGEFYQESTRDAQIKELWKQITMKIPKRTVFVVKNAQQYYLTEDLHFETVPEEFLEINPTAHMMLAECFETCYRQFKDLLKNYKVWENPYEATLPTIYLDAGNRNISKGEVEKFLENEQEEFEKILNVSLKSRMIDIVSPRIKEIYRSVYLDNEPIMLIIKTEGDIREIYSVSSELMVEKIQYIHIERQLEEIINRHVPVDSDFLVNRLYNHIMMPSKNIMPYVRIRTVNEKGINATLFTPDRQIPIVSDLQFKKVYIFALIEHNANGYPQSSYKINGDTIRIQPVSPKEGLREMQKMNETMFQDMTCYIEDIGKKYRIHGRDFDTNKMETWDAEDSLVYKLKQGELSLMESLEMPSSEWHKVEEIGRKAQKNGVYAFFRVERS